MTSVPNWALMLYTLSTILSVAALVVMSMALRRWRNLAMLNGTALHECAGVVTALASRGNIVCDACHLPVAPMTPTTIEETELGKFSISHRECPRGGLHP
jgi:hypothetical protein